MRRTWTQGGRRYFSFPPGDIANDDIREMEGRRWHGSAWSLPNSARASRFADMNDCIERGNGEVPRKYQGPQALWDALLPFQREDVEGWLRYDFCLNRNEQGTGKTFEAIAWAAGQAPVIVACPNMMVADQWVQLIERYGVSRKSMITEQDGSLSVVSEGGGASDWIFTTYVRCSKLDGRGCTLLLDECTHVKNVKAKRTKNVMALAAGAERIMALSAHPMVNKPLDLWALFLILRQRTEKEYWPWVTEYCGAYKTPYGWDLSGATHLRNLKDDIDGFSLPIRTLREVQPQLPPRFDVTIRIPRADLTRVGALAGQLATLVGRGESIEHGEGFGVVQHLRVECGLVKVPFVSEWLDAYFEGGGRKVLIFSDFHDPLDALSAVRKDVLVLTGRDAEKNRAALKRQFETDDTKRVLGLTYGVGAMGLNMQHMASTVGLLDLPWTPKDLEQAPSRVMRIGQEHNVNVVTFLCGHPIEVQMQQSLLYKEDVSNALKRYGGLKL